MRNPHAGQPFTTPDEQIAQALLDVSIPTLMLSLVHMSGDADLIRRELKPAGLFLNEVQGYMSEEDKAAVRKIALEVIADYRDRGCPEPEPIGAELLQEMMQWLVCEPVPDTLNTAHVMSSPAPRLVVGNLRLTDGGVYADYLLSGLPFIFLSAEWQNTVAAEHAELWRALPSGSSISGLTVPVPARGVARKMLHSHPALRTPSEGLAAAAARWVRHCRSWEPAIAGHRPRRRIYWLTVPLDYGPAGHTATGTWRNLIDTVLGRDKDTDSSLSHYRELAAVMVGALPRVFFAKPASVEQIWWHWNYTASRGVWPHPLPAQPHDPHASLPGSAFTPVHFDESAAALRGRRWRAARAEDEVFVRTYRDRTDGVADSYQALIALDSFPDTGVAWPRSTIFKVLDDLTRPDTTLDWTINTTFTTADTAVSLAHNVITNIHDQYRQRGRHASSDDELVRKLASGKELASELKRGAAERGVNPSIVIAAAAGDAQTVNAAREHRDQQLPPPEHRRAALARQPEDAVAGVQPGQRALGRVGGVPQPHHHRTVRQVRAAAGRQAGQQHRGAAGHEPDQPGAARRRAARPAQRAGPGEPGEPGDLRVTGARQVAHRQIADPGVAVAGRGPAFLRSEPAARTRTRASRFRRQDRHRPAADPGMCIDPLRIFPYARGRRTRRRSSAAAAGLPVDRAGRPRGCARTWPPRPATARGIGSTRRADPAICATCPPPSATAPTTTC